MIRVKIKFLPSTDDDVVLVFDLPEQLLASLTVRTTDQPIAVERDVEAGSEHQGPITQEHAIATSTSCALCQVSFQTVQDQRDHVRSDHHRYNIKAQLRGNPTLDEMTFMKAVGELDESISGSESSDAEETEQDDPPQAEAALAALLRRQAKIGQDGGDQPVATRRGPGKQPIYWLSSSLFPSNVSLGIYRALFTDVEQDEPGHLVDSLRRKQLKPVNVQGKVNGQQEAPALITAVSPHIFMCMIGGGHFAAMIVSLAPEIHRRQGGIEERQARVIAHKTFHRYTTRRKQGGAQSANDAAKGAAHSAGSSLRRYNEAALEKEIRELLLEWKQLIHDAQLIFVRATGNTNRRILFGPYDGQVLKQNDPRLRGFPFSTRRATQAELLRCFKELTRLKVSQVDEAALAQAEKSREETVKPAKPRTPPQKPKLSKEDEAAMLHTTQIQALIRRSKVPALLSYLTNNSISPSFTFKPSDSQQNFRCPTPLHFAAHVNSPSAVLALMTKANADPTIRNGEGRPPFDLAGDRPTRDAFRVARHEVGESKWDWDAAHVPSAISRSDADSRAERERKVAEEEEANRRKTELERLRREEAEKAAQSRESKRTTGRTLGALEKTAAEKRDEEARGMTPEMRMRLERERRARAAEERIRRMQGNAG